MAKPRDLRIQARDLVLKMFDYLKWRRHTVGQRTEMPSRVGTTALQRDVNWKWNKGSVINNATIAHVS